MPRDTRRLGRWAPAVLVAVPLTGLSFISDERRSVYLRTLTNDANPFRTAVDADRGIEGYLDSSTFRPVGRFWKMLVHGFVFDSSHYDFARQKRNGRWCLDRPPIGVAGSADPQ